MQDWLKQAQNGKGLLNFGAQANPLLNTTAGVNYISSAAGSQTYAASSLVGGR